MTGTRQALDMKMLFGFDSVAGAAVDFAGDAFGARLGAKVGDVEPNIAVARLDLSRLLGFEALDGLSGTKLDFTDDAAAGRVGAKVGNEPAIVFSAEDFASRLGAKVGNEPTIAFSAEDFASRLGAKIGEPEQH